MTVNRLQYFNNNDATDEVISIKITLKKMKLTSKKWLKKKCIQSLFDNIYLVILQITIKKKYCNNYDCYTSIRTANNSYKHINCDGKLVD